MGLFSVTLVFNIASGWLVYLPGVMLSPRLQSRRVQTRFGDRLESGSGQQSEHRAAQQDGVERMRHRPFGAGPLRQPRIVGATGEHHDRWARFEFVLELLGD